jgi:hypothetical protein
MSFPIPTRKVPPAVRVKWYRDLATKIKLGGALVVVDKIITPPGYAGTALRRMAMQWKSDSGVSSDDIIAKELSLAGYQRPINPNMLFPSGQIFFAFGDFMGWVIERSEI